MDKIRTKEEIYEACDFCGKEIVSSNKVHRIQGDFPTVSLHVEPCMRQAIVLGVEHNRDFYRS